MRNGLLVAAMSALGASAAWGGLTADLSVTKTDGAPSSVAGLTITYTIVAFNAGPSPAPGSGFGDIFLAPLENCTWACVGQNGGVCSVPAGAGANANQSVDLPVGGSVQVTATCDVASSANLSFFNTATITAPPGIVDQNQVNNSATDVNGVTFAADLAITKTDGSATFVPGGSTTYTIVGSNLGPSDTLPFISDIFPPSLTCTWTCSASPGAICAAVPAGAGNINEFANLPAGTTVTYIANCSIADGTASPLVNTATIAGPPNFPEVGPENNTATDIDVLGGTEVPALDGLGLAALGAALGLLALRRLRRH